MQNIKICFLKISMNLATFHHNELAHKLPKFIQQEKKNLNKPITTKGMEVIIFKCKWVK